MPLFLQRVVFGCQVNDFQSTGLDFPALAAALGCHQAAADGDGGAGGQFFDIRIIGQFFIGHDLNVFQAGAVIDLDEGKSFGITPGAHPAFDQHMLHEIIGI